MQYLAFLTVDAAKLKYSPSTKKIKRKENTSEESNIIIDATGSTG